MTPEQIREVVKMTLDELTVRRLIKDDYQSILKVVEVRLNKFFSGTKDKQLNYTLSHLSDDQYIDIIFLQYRDGKTLEWIAECLGVDVSTVKRNKKRLMCSIYDQLEEER